MLIEVMLLSCHFNFKDLHETCEKCNDAMAIMGSCRRLDLFITCNPNWLEIQHNPFPRHQSSEHPDLVAYAFHIKLNFFMDGVLKNGVLIE
jgi:hypothetical protein